MQILKFNIVPMEELEKRKAFREAVNNCPICNSALRFKHDLDFLSNSVKELAHCDTCQLQIREEAHLVQ